MAAQIEQKVKQAAPAEQTLLDGISIDELIQVGLKAIRFLRKWWLALAIGLIIGAAAGFGGFVMSPKVESAVFEVRLVPKVSDNPVAAFARSNVEFFASPEQNFTSQPLIEETCEELGWPTEEPGVLHEVKQRLSFFKVAHNTYKGSMLSEDGEEARRFLEAHSRRYLDAEIKKTLAVIQAEMNFLAGQLESVEGELKASEAALQEFREKHADGLPEQAEQHYNTLRTLQQRKIDTEAELEQVALELKLNKEKLEGEKLFVESRVISTQRKTPFEDALVGVQKEIAAARAAGLSESHPKVKQLAVLAETYQELAKQQSTVEETETESSRNPIYQSIQDTIYQLEVRESVARTRYDQIVENLRRATEIVASLPELERRYAELTRNYQTTSGLQERIFNQYKVTELQLSLEQTAAQSRYDIIAPPRVAYSSPFKKAILLVVGGGIFGLMLGFCIGLLVELKTYVARRL